MASTGVDDLSSSVETDDNFGSVETGDEKKDYASKYLEVSDVEALNLIVSSTKLNAKWLTSVSLSEH